VTALRTLRRTLGLTQAELAALLEVPVNSFRMWDSGLRPVPAMVLDLTKAHLARYAHEAERLPLKRLANELGVHVQTLQRAVRTGRLEASFSTRSVFGQPCRLATRAAAARFMSGHYHHRLSTGQTCTVSSCEGFDADCDFHRQLSPFVLALPAKRSCISGNRGSELLPRCSGNESKNSPTPVWNGRSPSERSDTADRRVGGPTLTRPIGSFNCGSNFCS
jgi:transcriptional regulator with XRE-family HTH domain